LFRQNDRHLMQTLITLMEANESWLVKRVLEYAKERQYTRYTSTLEEAWRISIAGLTSSFANYCRKFDKNPEIDADTGYDDDPLTAFGILEAQKHRKRGITLSMFLGLMKYYRQSYVDLVHSHIGDEKKREKYFYYIHRGFDRIEVAICGEWTRVPSEEKLAELQNANRWMTKEKNVYLTVFESLSDPAILLDEKHDVVNLNFSAARLIDPDITPGAYYYHSSATSLKESPGDEKNLPPARKSFIGKNVLDLFHWLPQEILPGENSPGSQEIEAKAVTGEKERYFDISYSRMPDVSGKFTFAILVFRDITKRKIAGDTLIHESYINAALSELYKPLISPSYTIQQVTDQILEQAQILTGSQHGFVATIDPETNDMICHTFTKMQRENCQVSEEYKKIVFPIQPNGLYKGIWGHCLNTKQPFFTNEPSLHPVSIGTPEGHIPLHSFLGVPVMLENQIVGMIALANKMGNYTNYDLDTVIRLAEYFALGIQRMRAELKLQEANDRLENRINERTAELTQANIQLNREIVERKQVEDALRQNEERFRAIADFTYDWENWIGPDNTITWTNPAVERISGYTQDEYMIHPNPIELMVLEEDRGKITQLLEEGLKKRISGDDINFRIRRKDGEVRWVSQSFQPIYGRDGKYLGLRTSIRDITERMKTEAEREKLQEQLLEAQKLEAIGTLAGGIAHDFNNILSAIIGYSELAMDFVPKENRARSMLYEIFRAGKRARDLIKQILTFSRQSTPERKPVELHYVIKEALNLLRATIPKTIQIQQDIDINCGTVHADPSQIHQVLMNFCTNAYHAMRENGGILAVSLKPFNIPLQDSISREIGIEPGPYVRLEISDTGHGMTRAILDRIFDPYFTTKKKGEGTGLGLAVVHGIIKSHHGHIGVYSEPGKGSTFTIYLPRIDKKNEAAENVPIDQLPTGTEHILFVDDELPIVSMGREMLRKLGYQVTATTNSVEALHRFMATPDSFQLVITDMTMPEMTGANLAKKILEIRNIPIILCTGFSDLVNEDKAKAMGFQEYIMKPILARDLAAAIRKVLDKT